jgi:hypothetical protein
MARLFKTGITSDGDIIAGINLKSNYQSGDEGGEIFLNKPVTNTTLVTGVTIDVNGDRLRFFENGGTNRGYYIDLASGGTSVGTNLVGGGGGSGTVTSITAGTNGLTGGTITTSGTIDIDTAKVPRLTTNTNTFGASSGATTLVIKQGPTQSTSNLTEWRDNAGTTLTGYVRPDGNAIIFGGVESTYYMTATAGTTTNVPMTVYGASGHTANLQDWKASAAGSLVASVSASGAFSGTTYNGLTVTTTTGTLTVASGKTLTASNSLTLAGTDGRTMTFPSTNATIARTDAAQTFTGTQTFSSSIDAPGIARTGSSSLALSTANQTGSAGSISITAGNSTSAGNGGSIDLQIGSRVSGGSPGTINIGTTNTPQAINIGVASAVTNLPGSVTVGSLDSTGSVGATGNLSTGGTLTRTVLVGGGTTGASINTSGQFIRTTSSERYKQDIQDAEFVYEDVLLLAPKTFRLKDEAQEDPNSRVYGGLIAEDVDQIESLKVFVNYKTEEDGSKIPDGIAYGEMVAALVSALKHQDARIEALEAQVQALSE